MWGGVSDCDWHALLQSERPMWTVTHLPLKSASSHCIGAGIPLCVGVHQAWDWCTSPTPVKPTPKGSERENMPWVASGLVPTQCQASKTSLGWINGKLWLLSWTSTGAFTEDGWRLQVMCSGSGCLQGCMHLAEDVDTSSSSVPLDNELNDCHNYSWNWVTVARP